MVEIVGVVIYILPLWRENLYKSSKENPIKPRTCGICQMPKVLYDKEKSDGILCNIDTML